MFDFDAALASAAKDAKSTALEALIMGPSGAGKSTLCGTFGCKTLYLYCPGENHGVKSAKSMGGADIQAMLLDCHDSELSEEDRADFILEYLHNLLGSIDQIKKREFGAVVIDGASELEYLIRSSSKWRLDCRTKKGEHNAFDEGKATINGFRTIINALKKLKTTLDIHVVLTCSLDVKELTAIGEISEAIPKLQGYSVAEAIVQQFGDILVVGRMVKNNQVKYKLQFMTEITKVSKEEKTHVIKKCLNFSPRIAGIKVGEGGLPAFMDADLSKVVELKKQHLK